MSVEPLLKTLEDKLETAKTRLARLPRPSAVPNDPAYVNLKGHLKGLDADIRKGVAVYELELEIGCLEQSIANRERRKPVPFTLEELRSARAVRTVIGWHKVVKVNAKSVTVESGYSWTDRYTLDKIMEVRT